jgi:hypothetical protein
MTFAVGQNFTNKFTNSNYQIYDITGQGGPVPSETAVVYLKLTSKSGFFNNSQQFVTITSRHLLEFFNPVTHK